MCLYICVHMYTHMLTHVFFKCIHIVLTWYKIDPCHYKNEHEQQVFVEHLLHARHCACRWGHRRVRTRPHEHSWQWFSSWTTTFQRGRGSLSPTVHIKPQLASTLEPCKENEPSCRRPSSHLTGEQKVPAREGDSPKVTQGDATGPSVQFSSVAQSCPTLCDPMNRSTPGLPVHHHHPDFPQTHVHQVGDAIQPSHPLSPPSSPAFNLSQHQGLFQWVSSSHQFESTLEFMQMHSSLTQEDAEKAVWAAAIGLSSSLILWQPEPTSKPAWGLAESLRVPSSPFHPLHVSPSQTRPRTLKCGSTIPLL